jgi:two-component system, response regulator YesN
MYNILVVDDDSVICEVVCRFIKTDLYKQEKNIYKAENGIQALEIVCSKRIDIIFADIKMPLCTGIEMMEKLHELQYGGQIVIISGFDDYSLVRQAMKLGAVDYLLKPIVQEELNTILQDCVNKAAQKEYINAFYSKYKVKDIREIMFMQQRSVEQMIKAKQDGICLLPEGTSALLCVLDTFRKNVPDDKNLQMLFLETKHWVEELCGNSITLWQGAYNNQWILILNNSDNLAGHAEAVKIQSYLESRDIRFGLADSAVPSEKLPAAYAQCLEKLKRFFYDLTDFLGENNEKYPYDSTMKSIISSVCTCNFIDFSGHISALFSYLCRDKPPLENTRKLLASVIYEVMSQNNEFISVISKYKLTDNDLIQYIQESYSAIELRKKMIEMINLYISEVETNRAFRDSYEIQKAKNFIEQEYMHDISLTEVSEKLSIHPNYFSAMFKAETGTTYSKYLRSVRILRAKELMKTTNFKLYEIADKVGYNDNAHFYRMFKEETGMSPGQYKKQIDLDKK